MNSLRVFLFINFLAVILNQPLWASKNKKHFRPKPNQTSQHGPLEASGTLEIKEKENPFLTSLKERLHLSAYYSLTNSGNFEGQRATTSMTGALKTTNAFGVGMDYRLKTFNESFVLRGLSHFEFGRSLTHLNWRKSDNSPIMETFEKQEALNIWIWSLQADFLLDDDLSVFAAFNYNDPTLKNAVGDLTGKWGWHTGASVRVAKNLNIEALWRSLNMTGSIDGLHMDEMNFSGLLIRGLVYLD